MDEQKIQAHSGLMDAKEEVKTAVGYGAVGAGGALVAQQSVAVAVPSIMSSLGTVVSGTGTLHGTITATLQGIAATSALPVIGWGAGIGLGVYAWKRMRKKSSWANKHDRLPSSL